MTTRTRTVLLLIALILGALLFSCHPRAVQPTVRLGVEVVGLPPDRQALFMSADLAPPPGGAFVCCGRALCNHAAGLLAAFAERCNSLCEGHPSWQAHPPVRVR